MHVQDLYYSKLAFLLLYLWNTTENLAIDNFEVVNPENKLPV